MIRPAKNRTCAQCGAQVSQKATLCCQCYHSRPKLYSKYTQCVECGKRIWKPFLRCQSCAKTGERNHEWGQFTSDKKTQGRDRAKRRFNMGPCEICGKPAHDRHHMDNNPLNNAPENIRILCRRCHMQLDGRLDKLKKWGPSPAKKKGPPNQAHYTSMKSEKQPPTIEGLLDLAGNFAHQVLLDMQFAQLAPSWLLVGRDGVPYIYATEWNNDQDKLAAEAFIRLRIMECQAVMYSFVGEAHVLRVPDTYKPGDVINKKDLPRGEEIVSAIATDGVRKVSRTWLIVRDEQSGQIVGLQDQGLGDGVPGGWVDSLLDDMDGFST